MATKPRRPRISKTQSSRNSQNFQFDVCLSFAGEDRPYVRRVAQHLAKRGVRFFYDEHQQVTLWGKDLYEHLDYVYRMAARFCVLFVSRHYASKLWTNHERRSIQARAFRENKEYILPVRFDKTDLPGLLETVGYVSLKNLTPQKLADLIVQKLGPRQRHDFLPPVPDRLFRRLKARTKAERQEVELQLRSFFEAFKRMRPEERTVIVGLIQHGCPTDLPKNLHINLDLLRRETGIPIPKLLQILGNLSSLGFFSRTRESHGRRDSLGEQRFVEVEFHAMNTDIESIGPHTGLIQAIYDEVGDLLCGECAKTAFLAGDFSQLSSSTMTDEEHLAMLAQSKQVGEY